MVTPNNTQASVGSVQQWPFWNTGVISN